MDHHSCDVGCGFCNGFVMIRLYFFSYFCYDVSISLSVSCFLFILNQQHLYQAVLLGAWSTAFGCIPYY